jgi:hypothetical protein
VGFLGEAAEFGERERLRLVDEAVDSELVLREVEGADGVVPHEAKVEIVGLVAREEEFVVGGTGARGPYRQHGGSTQESTAVHRWIFYTREGGGELRAEVKGVCLISCLP